MEEQLTVKRNPRGQSLVEFALTLPVLLLVFMGILDFGRLLITYTQASAQVRNALRYGVILGYQSNSVAGVPNYLDCSEMQKIAEQVFFAETEGNVTVTYVDAETGTTLSCPDIATLVANPDSLTEDEQKITIRDHLLSTCANCVDNLDIVQVHITAPVELITPFLAQTLTIDVQGQRTLVQQIDLPRLGLPAVGPPPPLSATCESILADYANGITPAPPDSEPNGMDDVWECQNFSDTGQNPAGNPDGDLCDNLCEFTNDTDPNDPRDPDLRLDAPQRLAYDDANSDGRDDASHCTDFKSMRWVGLSWQPLDLTGYTDIDAIISYRVYATPVNGPRFLIAEVPAGTTSCGYSQSTDGSGCFEALPNSTYENGTKDAADFWTQFGSRTIDYSVAAYNDVGQSIDSPLQPIICDFRVQGLALLPEDAGTNCLDAADGTPETPYYRGLSWDTHPEATGYYIYARKQNQTKKVGDVSQATCGYSVSGDTAGVSGCFNLEPAFWATGKEFSFRIRPYYVGATIIEGPADEALPPGAWVTVPTCPLP